MLWLHQSVLRVNLRSWTHVILKCLLHVRRGLGLLWTQRRWQIAPSCVSLITRCVCVARGLMGRGSDLLETGRDRSTTVTFDLSWPRTRAVCPLWARSRLLFAASYKSTAFYALKMAAGERTHKILPSCENPFCGDRCILAVWIFLACFVERQRGCQCASARAERLLARRAGCWAGCEVAVWWFAPLGHGTANEHGPSGHRKHTGARQNRSDTASADQTHEKAVFSTRQTAGCCIFFIINSESIQLGVKKKITYFYLLSLMIK